jgi:hypothetical protein
MTRLLLVYLLLAGCGDEGKTYQFDLHVVGEDGGGGTVIYSSIIYDMEMSCADHCKLVYSINERVQLTAQPDTGSVFAAWSGDCVGTEPQITVVFPGGTKSSCTATFRGTGTAQPETFTTLGKPEGIDLFHVGPNRPAGLPLVVATGLADGTYVAVASGDTAGGLDLVHLETGARKTNEFVDVSPAYGVTVYQTSNGPRWQVFGGGGSAIAGWNNGAQDFGLTQLGLPQNTTQVSTADFNDDGTVDKVMLTGPTGEVYVQAGDGTGAVTIDATAYVGTAAQPISGQFGRTADEALIVLVDGRVFFGPVAGAADRLSLVGSAGTSPRLMSCAGAMPRICAIADYGGDQVFVVEIDTAGARIVGSRAVGDAPIDPAVLIDGGRARIAVTGSGDNTIEILAYDPASEMLTVDVPRAMVPDCVAPNHVRWQDLAVDDAALVSCYGGTTLVRLHM